MAYIWRSEEVCRCEKKKKLVWRFIKHLRAKNKYEVKFEGGSISVR